MAFNNNRSWRLRFIDIDNSYVVNESDDEIIGYFVCRAPKGNQRPTYFPKDNSGAIDALVGVGSANWPDILEAQAFNKEYPCYISAPAGSSKIYKSHLGGFYLTINGIYKFYNVESKSDLENTTGNAFKVKVIPGEEEKFDSSFASKKSEIVIAGPTLTDYTPTESEVGYGFVSTKKDDTWYISIKKPAKLNVTAIDYDEMRKGLVSAAGTDTTYWGDEDGLWSFSGNTAKYTDFGHVYSAEEKAEAGFNPLKDWIGDEAFEAVGDDMGKLISLLVNGYVAASDDENVSIAFGLQGLFFYQVDIHDDVIAYFMQKSPTETQTLIDITSIGYDKYYYERLLNYAPYKIDENKHLTVNTDGLTLSDLEQAELKEAIEGNEYLGFYDPEKPEAGIKYIGKRNDDDEDDVYYEISGDLNTKYLAFQDTLAGSKVASIYHKFYKPVEGDDVRHIFTEEEDIEIWGTIDGPLNYEAGLTAGTSVPVSPTFNQITLSCSEEVYTGQTTSGGTFTGSLDENGKNSYGNSNYFLDVLSDDDFSFLEVRILRKLGDKADDLDENGFWNKKRVIDPYDIDKDGTSPTETKFYVEGDRYCTLVMQQNLVLGKLGGDWNDNYKQIIADGLEEATLGEYDDAFLFVEPTGQECFKPALAKIARAQQNAAVISPKLLTPNSKGIVTNTIASKVVVTDRTSEGCNCLYAGEFEVKDDVTKKKYWRKPVGSVAKMFARIYDKRYGGAAPAWINENGLGGQLDDFTAIRSRYQLDEDAEKTLDEKGINPIVMTAQEGVMIVSQKTNRDPNFKSDWSYIGHALSFLLVRRNIRDEVMRPQVMKPINSYYMQKRTEQVNGILSKRLSGDNPVWTDATVDIEGVNNEYTKANRDFVIEVAITCTPFSETVTLRLVHNLAA